MNHFYHSIHSDLVDDFIQYKTYITGVGTDKFPLLGGMFGFGISDQIMSAYKFICNLYRNENDEIWLIGFSRGGK